jgi:hypothetical protein
MFTQENSFNFYRRGEGLWHCLEWWVEMSVDWCQIPRGCYPLDFFIPKESNWKNLYQQCPLQSLPPTGWCASGVISDSTPVNFFHPPHAHTSPQTNPQLLLVTKLTVQDLLQPILTKLETFCSDWRMGINPTKTWCLNFYNKNANNNSPRLWLMGELVDYCKMGKFLGVTLDSQMTFEPHLRDISARCRKGLNLLKMLRGQSWGANPEVLMYSYKSFVRPLMEYSSVFRLICPKNCWRNLPALRLQQLKLLFSFPLGHPMPGVITTIALSPFPWD